MYIIQSRKLLNVELAALKNEMVNNHKHYSRYQTLF